MGRYLNSQTREDSVVVCGVVDLFKDITTRWNTNMKTPPEKVIGYIQAASRFASRAIKELNKEIDENEVERIIRMAETTKFRLSYVQCDLSSKAPDVKTYDITEDERDLIVEALAEVRCSDCNGCIASKCTVREQFFKWDVEPIYDATDEIHPCQYMYPD